MDEDTTQAAWNQQEQELQQLEESSMTTPKLNKALCEARKEIENPSFDSENPHFRNKFASLKAVIRAVVPVMAKHGIAVVQDLQTIDGGIACLTHLLHDSGESMTLGPLVLTPTGGDPQKQASASTYARRYHLMAVGCVVGDVDDDGNAASASNFKSKQMKAKYYDGLKAGAAEDDALKVRELWDELETEQQLEIWNDLKQSSRVRTTIKRLLDETAEKKDVTV